MPISSASTRIFHAEDPVLENDLQLLAKVNEYQQEKFDEGAKDLQNEVNNWSMLANVAKPQDKAYINAKLNKLVSGIQQMGGINLRDHNNVNALKSLGYNMYGDDNVMNPVLTTKRMQALQQDIYDKTTGKNSKDYDSVFGEYLLDQYSDWLNDGKQGTKYDGPMSLPQGNFDQYNKKINDAITKLVPDMNEAPQNATDALNYYQVGNKFIKKERIWAAIDANTTAQDKEVMSAHAWKSMRGLPDSNLVNLQRNAYDASIADLQSTWNTLQQQKSITNDYAQKELFTNQMNQIKDSIGSITSQKNSLPQLQQGQSLDKGVRQMLSDNLFMNSYKEQISNARAYEQKKIELKANQGKIAELRMAQSAYFFAQNYAQKEKEFSLRERAEAFKEQMGTQGWYGMYGMSGQQLGQVGITGPAQNSLLSVMPNLGKDDATVLSDELRKQADANFIAKSDDLFTQGYNYLMKKDSQLYFNFLIRDQNSGNWIPKDDRSKEIVNKGLQSCIDLYGQIANMSISEREGLKLNDDDLTLYSLSKGMKEAQLYKDQMTDLTNQAFIKAGVRPPSQQQITINLNDGKNVTLTYDKLKEMQERNDPLLDTWRKLAPSTTKGEQYRKEDEVLRNKYFPSYFDQFNKSKVDAYSKEQKVLQDKYSNLTSTEFLNKNAVDIALSTVDDYYNTSSVKDAFTDLSKTFNVYGKTVTLPKFKGKVPEALQTYLSNTIRDQHSGLPVQSDDVDLLRIWTVYKADEKSPNKARYMAEVRYQKGSGTDKGDKADKGDKLTTIDLTEQVLRDHNSEQGGFFGNLFPDDNSQVVYGMMLNNKGATPFNAKNNYDGALQTRSNGLLAHKYQVVAMKNGNNGIDGYQVNVLIPKGRDLRNGTPIFQSMPVINFDAVTPQSKTATTQFPNNLKYVQDYMDSWFSTEERVKDFYRMHGIPYITKTIPQDQTQQ